MQELLADSIVVHVYCLNRSLNSSLLQHERNSLYGLAPYTDTTPSPKVTYLTADVTQSQFGLTSDMFSQLLNTVSLVIHNAWPVNFNMSLESFRPQLDSLINLIRFAAYARKLTRFFFISSVGSILSYRSASHITPEAVIDLDSLPLSNGYSESKAVSETLLDHATRRLNIHVAIARVGQIAGAVTHAGLWNRAEWFPSLVITSLHVGVMPDSLGPTLGNVDWVPIDLLAGILVELSKHEREDLLSNRESPAAKVNRGAHVFHPYSPRPTTWTGIRVTAIDELARLRPDKSIETVSLHAWISRVKKDAEMIMRNSRIGQDKLEEYLQVILAVKLLDFYESLLSSAKNVDGANVIESKETIRCSPKLQALEGIKDS